MIAISLILVGCVGRDSKTQYTTPEGKIIVQEANKSLGVLYSVKGEILVL